MRRLRRPDGATDLRILGEPGAPAILSLIGADPNRYSDFTYNGSATDPYGNERVGFEGKAEILRSEWGLTWNAALETGGVLVSDKIKLHFDISAIKQA